MSQTQFSLRTLFAAVTVVGIGAALWVAEPSWWLGAIEALLLIWAPASAVILSVNSGGKARAWWIGIAADLLFAIYIHFSFWFPLADAFSTQNLVDPYKYDYMNSIGSILFFALKLSARFRPILISWAFAPVVGLLCVFTHWLWIRPPEPKA